MEISFALLHFGMTNEVDPLVFHLHSISRLCIYLIVYVNDIVIIGYDSNGIMHLSSLISIVNLKHRTLVYSSTSLALKFPIIYCCFNFLEKYAIDILIKFGILGCRPSDNSIDPNVKLLWSRGSKFGRN